MTTPPAQSERPVERNGDVRVRLLGTGSVERAGGEPGAPSRKALALLAFLALERRAHPRETLAAWFWPESSEGTARSALRNALSELRTFLGPALQTERQTVELATTAELSIDTQALLAALRAPELAELGRLAELAPQELLSGFPTSDVPEFEDWLLREREIWRQRVGELYDKLGELRAGAGDTDGALAATARWLGIEPLAEAAHRRLIELHFGAGERDAAIRAYESCRALLKRELGVAPSAETEALARRVLSAEPPVRRVLLGAPPPLGAPPNALLGRDAELAEMQRLLDGGVRLLTLTGPGGVGKTRFALELARRLVEAGRDVWCVSLASVREPSLVMPSVARVLGLADEATQPALEQIVAAVGKRPISVLLDNFEQVLPAAAELSALLERCPTLSIVVTTRAVLRVRGEHVFALGPLSIAAPSQDGPALTLFVERARAAGGRISGEDELDAVRAICRRLDGLPLALELAAARTRALSVAELRARLERGASPLAQGAVDLPARQKTLRDAMLWSYELLAPDERAAFRRLGVLDASFRLAAFEAVCGDHGERALDRLETLVDHSLVVRAGERYRVLETIRELAAERLDAEGERAEAQDRHTAHVEALVAREARRITGSEQAAALDALEAEHAEIGGALSACFRSEDPDFRRRGLGIASSLTLYWHLRGHWYEGRRWLGRGLEVAREVTDADRGRALYSSGMLACAQEDFDVARTALDQSLALLPPGVDDERRAWALGFRAVVQIYARRVDGVLPFLDEGLGLCRALGDRFGEGLALLRLGIVALIEGDAGGSADRCLEAEAVFRSLGNAWGVALSLHNLGEARIAQDDARGARAAFVEGFEHLEKVGSEWYRALGGIGLAGAVAIGGNPAGAARLLAAARASLDARGSHLPPLDRQIYERNLALVERLLGADEFGRAWAEGFSTPLAQALETHVRELVG